MFDLKRHLRNLVSCGLQIIVIVALTILHLFAWVACLKHSHFVDSRPLAAVLEGAAYVLCLPMIAVSKGVFWINSLLWGLGLWAGLAWLSRKRLAKKKMTTTNSAKKYIKEKLLTDESGKPVKDKDGNFIFVPVEEGAQKK